MSLVQAIGEWNLSIIGLIGAFLFWLVYAYIGDWKPTKKMPHWVARYDREHWAKAAFIAPLFLLVYLIATFF
jgi:hypothetical protein